MPVKFIETTDTARQERFEKIMQAVSEASSIDKAVARVLVQHAFSPYDNGDFSVYNRIIIPKNQEPGEKRKVLEIIRMNFDSVVKEPEKIEKAMDVVRPAVDMMFEEV
jgi:hypothetical protein